MSRSRLALAAMLSMGIASAIASVRAECATLSLDQEFRHSTAVFVGRAAAQSVLTEGGPWRTETTFDVERLWKGKPDADKRLRVRTCGVGCPESARFVVGTQYAVFAEGDPLTTNTCHHTGWVEQAKKTIDWLRRKESRNLQ